jgi:hypothetical protein
MGYSIQCMSTMYNDQMRVTSISISSILSFLCVRCLQTLGINHCLSPHVPLRESKTHSWNDFCKIEKHEQSLAWLLSVSPILSQELHWLTTGQSWRRHFWGLIAKWICLIVGRQAKLMTSFFLLNNWLNILYTIQVTDRKSKRKIRQV